MGALRIIVGLAACALLPGTVAAAAGQVRSDPGLHGRIDGRDSAGGGSAGAAAAAPGWRNLQAGELPRGAREAAKEALRRLDPPPSRAAVEAAVARAKAAAASMNFAPPRLSKDAPHTAPTVGIIGTRPGSGGPSPAATPEPSTLLLMGAGLVGLARLRRRR